jgi:hypothetical protein
MEHFADYACCGDSVSVKMREATDETIFLSGFFDYFRCFVSFDQEFRDVFGLRHAESLLQRVWLIGFKAGALTIKE